MTILSLLQVNLCNVVVVVVVNHSNIIQSLTLPPPPRGQTLLPVDPVMLVLDVLVVLVVVDLELARWLLC